MDMVPEKGVTMHYITWSTHYHIVIRQEVNDMKSICVHLNPGSNFAVF